MGGTGLKFESWKVIIHTQNASECHFDCSLKDTWILKSGCSLKCPSHADTTTTTLMFSKKYRLHIKHPHHPTHTYTLPPIPTHVHALNDINCWSATSRVVTLHLQFMPCCLLFSPPPHHTHNFKKRNSYNKNKNTLFQLFTPRLHFKQYFPFFFLLVLHWTSILGHVTEWNLKWPVHWHLIVRP